jgi:hypothetical protein
MKIRNILNPAIVASVLSSIALFGCARYRTAELMGTVELHQDIMYKADPNSEVAITLTRTDLDNRRALIRITNTTDNSSKEDWVHVNDYSSVSPLTGTRGLRLIKVMSASAIVEIRSAISSR